MIIQAYQTFRDFNQTGIEGLFKYSAEVTSVFIPMLFLVFFLILFFGIVFNTDRKTGRADYAGAFAVAGWVTAMLAYALDLITGVVNLLTMVVVTVVAIAGVAFLLFGKER